MCVYYSRRQFLKTAAVAAAASMLPLIGFRSAYAAGKSRVVVASHAELVGADETIQPRIVRAAIDDMLMELTGTASARDAWMALLPNLQTTDVIGIKVNCINSRQASHPEVIYPLAESLTSSLGMNPNNIIVWDRTGRELKQAKYTLNREQQGVRCLATADDIGYDKNAVVEVGNGKQVHLSRILSEMCAYLINVPVLKDHGIAGLTLSLKNHYGSIDHPGSCHGNGCDPYVANLNAAALIRAKTKLLLCDALFGIYQGGPGGRPQWMNRQLFASTDPVAFDSVGMTMIDAQRAARKLAPVAPRVKYLATAAQLGLGTNDPTQIERIDMTLK